MRRRNIMEHHEGFQHLEEWSHFPLTGRLWRDGAGHGTGGPVLRVLTLELKEPVGPRSRNANEAVGQFRERKREGPKLQEPSRPWTVFKAGRLRSA